jgi:hypothetical protein
MKLVLVQLSLTVSEANVLEAARSIGAFRKASSLPAVGCLVSCGSQINQRLNARTNTIRASVPFLILLPCDGVSSTRAKAFSDLCSCGPLCNASCLYIDVLVTPGLES